MTGYVLARFSWTERWRAFSVRGELVGRGSVHRTIRDSNQTFLVGSAQVGSFDSGNTASICGTTCLPHPLNNSGSSQLNRNCILRVASFSLMAEGLCDATNNQAWVCVISTICTDRICKKSEWQRRPPSFAIGLL